jgi:hypothetical protein
MVEAYVEERIGNDAKYVLERKTEVGNRLYRDEEIGRRK